VSQSNVVSFGPGSMTKMGHVRWLVAAAALASGPLLATAVVNGAHELGHSKVTLHSQPVPVATWPPRAQTAPPLPVQMPLPPLPPIGEQFLPTLAPAAKAYGLYNTAMNSGNAATLPQFGGGEVQELERFLEPGWPGTGLEALLRRPPLVVSAPPGTDDAATASIRALRTLILWMMIFMSCLGVMGVTCVAYQYRSHKATPAVSKYGSHEDFQSFKTGLFDCWDDLPLFCFVFQCPWIRWAENVSTVSNASAEPGEIPILGFWIAFATFLLLTVLSNAGGPLVYIITVCFLAYFRQKFRRAFSMKSNTGSCLQDFFLYLCCCYCLIAQDARHIEEAKKQEHPAIVAP